MPRWDPEPGWLKRQIEDARAEVRTWPRWLIEARGLAEFVDKAPAQQQQPESKQRNP